MSEKGEGASGSSGSLSISSTPSPELIEGNCCFLNPSQFSECKVFCSNPPSRLYVRLNGRTTLLARGDKRIKKGDIAVNSLHRLSAGVSTGKRSEVQCCPQTTIDKYTLQNTDLAAITRRDPTIVGRIWPVAENYTALVLLDNLVAHFGYQTLKEQISSGK